MFGLMKLRFIYVWFVLSRCEDPSYRQTFSVFLAVERVLGEKFKINLQEIFVLLNVEKSFCKKSQLKFQIFS
jgi:hypothetical protein